MEPRIQYAKTADGVNIAYAVAGNGSPVLVCALPFSHVQALPEFGAALLVPKLASHFQTAWLDGRGIGMSDRDVADTSFDEAGRIEDLLKSPAVARDLGHGESPDQKLKDKGGSPGDGA